MQSRYTVIAGFVYEIRSGKFGIDVVCTGLESFSVSELLVSC